MWIYCKMSFYFCDQSCIFSIITPVFSVTWEIIVICWFIQKHFRLLWIMIIIIINAKHFLGFFSEHLFAMEILENAHLHWHNALGFCLSYLINIFLSAFVPFNASYRNNSTILRAETAKHPHANVFMKRQPCFTTDRKGQSQTDKASLTTSLGIISDFPVSVSL